MPEEIDHPRRDFCATAALAIVASQLAGCANGAEQSGAGQLPIEGRFPSLDKATGWLNSPPLLPSPSFNDAKLPFLRRSLAFFEPWTLLGGLLLRLPAELSKLAALTTAAVNRRRVFW